MPCVHGLEDLILLNGNDLQNDVQIQCNLCKHSNCLLPRNGQADPKSYVEFQGILINQNNPEKGQDWRTQHFPISEFTTKPQ